MAYYDKFLESIIIYKNKIKYIINKINKYTLHGGTQIENKLQDIPKVSDELTIIINKLKFYILELNKLMNAINDINQKNKLIDKIDMDNFTEKYNRIKEILNIDYDNNFNELENSSNDEQFFIINLRKMFYGFYKDKKFINKEEFNSNLQESFKNKITALKQLNQLIIQYMQKIENQNLNVFETPQLLLNNIEQQIKKANVEKMAIDIKPIQENKNISSIEPINLEEIIKLGNQVVNLEKYKFQFSYKDIESKFIGGNQEIIQIISDFNNDLDKCEKNLDKLEKTYFDLHLKRQRGIDYFSFISKNLNRKPRIIFRYINKKILIEYLAKINLIKKSIELDNKNKDYKYFTIITILQNGLNKFIDKINDEIIIDINKLNDDALFLFSLFNDFYNERLVNK